jgi:hypothetical protein
MVMKRYGLHYARSHTLSKLCPLAVGKISVAFYLVSLQSLIKKDTDPWFKFSGAIEEFNDIRRNELCCSLWISVDETMSAWRPRKTATGGLPNISFIVRKPELLGKI